MTAILISTAFGAISFSLIVAVCIGAMKPVRSPASQHDSPDCSATPVTGPTLPVRMDSCEQFLPFGASSELGLPNMTLRIERLASLPLCGPLRLASLR
jgi:hypothetical protein